MIAALVRQRATWAACSAAPRVGSQRFLHSALASLSKFTCAATPETPFDSSAFRTSVVDSLASLESAKRAVLASTRVALDTEFVRGINYSPSLELVQLATTDHTIHVVDCRVLEELQRGAVTDLLNAVISKPVVLHAADADLQLVYHWTQQLPANGIFDTQVLLERCRCPVWRILLNRIRLSNALNRFALPGCLKAGWHWAVGLWTDWICGTCQAVVQAKSRQVADADRLETAAADRRANRICRRGRQALVSLYDAAAAAQILIPFVSSSCVLVTH